MTISFLAEARAERDRLAAELDQIADRLDAEKRTTTPSEDKRADDLLADLKRATERVADLEAVEASRDAARPAMTRGVRRTGSGEHDDARRTLEAEYRSGRLPDRAAEKAEGLLSADNSTERSTASRWIRAAGNPDYLGAFAKLAADPTRGHLMWGPAEQDAWRAVEEVRSDLEGRAMSTTAAAGGAMIPLSLDPAILLTSDGSNNPLRQLATTKLTATNTWQGVTSAGASSEWKSEGSEAADGSPTLASPSIDVHLYDCFVPYSFEVGQDALDFVQELQAVMVDSVDNLQAAAFTTGTGSGQPEGIVTGLVGTSSEINGVGAETTTSGDPYKLQNALPARFSANASFQSHIAIANEYRVMETSAGAIYFPEMREMPASLGGKPWYENSNMDSSYDPTATANNYVLLYGDVAAGFYIVDRVGSTLELIPNLVGANQRPTGQRGAILWGRTGSEVVVPQALRLLDIPTTA